MASLSKACKRYCLPGALGEAAGGAAVFGL